MKIVDLRSDTVTRPSPEMYQAMREAPLGDDVLGDDPTVIKLETLAAEKLGFEAALFVPSGTMGNQICLAVHTKPGDAIIIEEEAHIIYYEVGGPAIFSNVLTWTLPSERGVMEPEVIRRRITKANLHTPGTSLICVENTHNRAGGTTVPLAYLGEYREIADEYGLKLHADGARMFNASAALGVDIREITMYFDSVSVCLSKGLRAPVGSVIGGSHDFIQQARIWRKRFGGGMRQSGILAACGIVSLEKMVNRLTDDHARCNRLAVSLGRIQGLSTEPDHNPTNLCMVQTDRPAQEWADRLHELGVWCYAVGPNRIPPRNSCRRGRRGG
jgi:threonine aldolase